MHFESVYEYKNPEEFYWDVTPCRQVKTDLHFRGTLGLYLQERRLSHVSK
jgi:hypothetical protein